MYVYFLYGVRNPPDPENRKINYYIKTLNSKDEIHE